MSFVVNARSELQSNFVQSKSTHCTFRLIGCIVLELGCIHYKFFLTLVFASFIINGCADITVCTVECKILKVFSFQTNYKPISKMYAFVKIYAISQEFRLSFCYTLDGPTFPNIDQELPITPEECSDDYYYDGIFSVTVHLSMYI